MNLFDGPVQYDLEVLQVSYAMASVTSSAMHNAYQTGSLIKNSNLILPVLWMVTKQIFFGITRNTSSLENRADTSHAIPTQCDQVLKIKNVTHEWRTSSRTMPTLDS
jgi:hypothetical protein